MAIGDQIQIGLGIIQFLAILVSGYLAWVSINLSKSNQKVAEESLNESKNAIEISKFNNLIYSDEIIYSAKKELRNYMLEILKNNKICDQKTLNSIKEDLLNAFELSCGLYLSKAVNKERFEKLRKQEIIDLFRAKNDDGSYMYEKLQGKDNRFQAIESVYNKFKDKE